MIKIREILRLTLLAALGAGILLCPPRSAAAEDGGGGEAVSIPALYRNWVDVLEESGPPDASWENPFGAPGTGRMTDQEMKSTLSFRRLARNGDREQLSARIASFSGNAEELPAPLRFWLAYSLNTLERYEASLDNLLILLEMPDAADGLEPGQLVWALTAAADQLFLLGARDRAAELFLVLAESTVEQLGLWGNYQLAGIDFLNRDFPGAERRYGLVCESEKSGTWHEHACAMADISGRLGRLNLKGGKHGDLAVVTP